MAAMDKICIDIDDVLMRSHSLDTHSINSAKTLMQTSSVGQPFSENSKRGTNRSGKVSKRKPGGYRKSREMSYDLVKHRRQSHGLCGSAEGHIS